MPTNKDLQKILDESTKFLEFWKKHNLVRMYEKQSEVIEMMMKFSQIQRNFTREDIHNRFSWIPTNLDKMIYSVTREDLEAYIKEMFEKTFTYRFFFPTPELQGFPEGFEIGYGRLLPFPKLPEEIKEYISREWAVRYEWDKGHYARFEDYKKHKENELYLCLEITSFGRDKATLLASEKANKSLNILKSVYKIHLSPFMEGYYYVVEREWYGGTGRKRWQWQSHEPRRDKLIDQINEIYSKDESNELESRIKSAIDTYGIIDMATPLNIKFLLTVISMEALLIGERGSIGLRFRERAALLLGGSREWLGLFLNKNPKKITEEEVDKRLVSSRIELSGRMRDMYEKRSQFAHRGVGKKKPKEEITEEDFRFAEWIYILLLRKLLDLCLTRGIDRVKEEEEGSSLSRYLEEIKFASRG